ncbi:MAG: DNA mismatch repair protein MutS, partial [Myxococcota bacterium]
GRGTATFDGLSIAWSVAEYLHDHLGAKTMFATHYHELTELAQSLDGALNMSIAVREYRDDIIFLRKLVDGPANRSYGIQVGRLAGLPAQVVGRAKEVLEILEQGHFEQLQAEHYVHTPTPTSAEADAPEDVIAEVVSPELSVLPERLDTDAEVVLAPDAAVSTVSANDGQLSLFNSAMNPGEARAIQALREVSIGHMTPIQALLFLDKLARELSEGS